MSALQASAAQAVADLNSGPVGKRHPGPEDSYLGAAVGGKRRIDTEMTDPSEELRSQLQATSDGLPGSL